MPISVCYILIFQTWTEELCILSIWNTLASSWDQDCFYSFNSLSVLLCLRRDFMLKLQCCNFPVAVTSVLWSLTLVLEVLYAVCLYKCYYHMVGNFLFISYHFILHSLSKHFFINYKFLPVCWVNETSKAFFQLESITCHSFPKITSSYHYQIY